MSKPLRNPNRPTTPERYDFYTALSARNNRIIKFLEKAYAQTGNENIVFALREMESEIKDFWELESHYRSEEMDEFWARFGQWGDSVRDWFLHFHDQDMEA